MSSYLSLNSGASIPIVGLGTSFISKSSIANALDCGYRHIDTAYIYKNENMIGEVLKEVIASGKIKREELFITSKLPPIGTRESDVQKFLNYSLRDLRLDYIDLYLIHAPFSLKAPDDVTLFPLDENGKLKWEHVDIEAVWRGMERMVDIGLAKSIGVSNFNSEQLKRVAKCARIMPCVNQVESHLYLQQRELKKVCDENDIKIIAFSPLGAFYKVKSSGVPAVLEDPVLCQVARNKGKTPSQVALQYLIQLGYIVIPKSDESSRLKQNIQVMNFSLNDEEMKQLELCDKKSQGRIFKFINGYPGAEEYHEYPFHIPY